MAEKVAKLGIARDKDFMLYVKDGQVWRVRRKQPGLAKGKPELLNDAGLQMDYDYIYFVDRDGDVSRAKRAVGGQKRKAVEHPARRPATKRARSGAKGRPRKGKTAASSKSGRKGQALTRARSGGKTAKTTAAKTTAAKKSAPRSTRASTKAKR